MYKALILDMDGTVINSEKTILHSLELLLPEYGLTLTPELRRRSIGSTSESFIASLKLREDPKVFADRWLDVLFGLMDQVVPYDGMAAVLSAPIRRGLVTSQIRAELTANLNRLGIGGLFECSVCADELPYQKPRPEPLLHCIAAMGLSTADVLYVGDTSFDIDCARAAGVDFGLAGWGADAEAEFPHARYVFQRPEELLPHIQPKP